MPSENKPTENTQIENEIVIEQKIAPYGTWPTPFTSKVIVEQSISFGTINLDGDDIYWIESRPKEGGRYVIVKCNKEGVVSDAIPSEYSAKTKVHEYGGGAYTVHDGVIYFSNNKDQRLYQKEDSKGTECLNTPQDMRFAEMIFDKNLNRLIAICEDHRNNSHEPTNSVVAIALDGSGQITTLTQGCDFYAMPKISPDGQKLAWLSWNHPNMPWDGTELYVASFNGDGNLESPVCIAGSKEESIVQPEWSPEGQLYFISDRTGWWNIYRQGDSSTECVYTTEAEFCGPAWVFGNSYYAFIGSDQLICTYNQNGFWHIGIIDTKAKHLSELCTDYTDICWLKSVGHKAIFQGASPLHPATIVSLDLDWHEIEVLAQSIDLVDLDPDMVSEPKAIDFPSDNSRVVHGFYYSPKNKFYKAPENEKPPLMVKAHGGPTASASTELDMETQFWTSRGFAVLDVNFSGSTGYGRPYRELLAGGYGIIDVEDCVNGAKYLLEQGLVDGNRLIISGSSSGGYVALCALTFKNIFKAAASYYAISDLEAITKDTHKFELHYNDKLVGPYPEKQELYAERSPINHTDKLSCPVIFFQGLDDKVVPPSQTERMVEALRQKKIPVACIMFEGEQHGFRQAETKMRCLDAELYFYSKIFNFSLPEVIMPVSY